MTYIGTMRIYKRLLLHILIWHQDWQFSLLSQGILPGALFHCLFCTMIEKRHLQKIQWHKWKQDKLDIKIRKKIKTRFHAIALYLNYHRFLNLLSLPYKCWTTIKLIPLRAKQVGECIEIRHKKMSPTRILVINWYNCSG